MDNPKDMIAKIKVHHQCLVDSLNQIRPLVRSYHETKPLMRELQEILLAHFQFQSKSFYEQLRDFYAEDHKAQKMIEFLVQDLKELKVQTLILFDDHPGDMMDIKPGHFLKDFEVFSKSLLDRINIERDYLIPMVEKLENSSPR